MNLVQPLIFPLCETVIMLMWMHNCDQAVHYPVKFPFIDIYTNIAYSANKTDVVDDTNGVCLFI